MSDSVNDWVSLSHHSVSHWRDQLTESVASSFSQWVMSDWIGESQALLSVSLSIILQMKIVHCEVKDGKLENAFWAAESTIPCWEKTKWWNSVGLTRINKHAREVPEYKVNLPNIAVVTGSLTHCMREVNAYRLTGLAIVFNTPLIIWQRKELIFQIQFGWFGLYSWVDFYFIGYEVVPL